MDLYRSSVYMVYVREIRRRSETETKKGHTQ